MNDSAKGSWKIINLKISGIKNIEKEIKIKFLNETLDSSKSIKLKNKRIKTIYGTNGSGKSAIMTAMDLYKNITSLPGYISQEEVIRELDSIINVKTREFNIEVVFAYLDENRVEAVLKHHIRVFKGNLVPYQIEEYCYTAQDIKNLNGSYSLVYSNIDGNLYSPQKKGLAVDLKMELERQRLTTTSVSSLAMVALLKYLSLKKETKKFEMEDGDLDFPFNLVLIYGFSISIKVYLDIKDRHQFKNPYIDIKKKLKNTQISEEILTLLNNDSEKYYYSSLEDEVSKGNFNSYLQSIKGIEEFIRIIKPGLNKISISKKIFGNSYRCRKIFEYDFGSVDLEYESTGIKKMVDLYSYINSAFEGGIVFIDEIDANISGVFLDKLMACFNEYGLGQLCFTSHNYYSMNKLKKIVSITTIGETGMVVEIPKNGNQNPANSFYDGDILDSPFNILENDFYRIFVDQGE